MQAFNAWWIDHYFAAKKPLALVTSTQHNGAFKPCLLQTLLEALDSTKHVCFVLLHALTRSSCENDGDGHTRHLNAFFRVHQGRIQARTTSPVHGGARPFAHDLTSLRATTLGGGERPLHLALRSI